MNSHRMFKIFSLVFIVGFVGSFQNASAERETGFFSGWFAPVANKVTVAKRKRITRPAKNSKKYNALISRHARAVGVPFRLANAVVQVESSYNPRARGRAGEIGLMQIMPATARGIGYRGKMSNLYKPDTNLYWGMKYLGEAYKRAGGNTCGTIMRYNGGLYAKKLSANAARYCKRVKAIMRRG